ncbi:hypothetical protein [Archangium sp.]|uniref:hypothetical protein n=1 Tax=Archangium sp. TaxID=1872627 RepID=UPI002D6275B2|nr:hypothetical protein [Archangium sp.]HYO53093.1 hypothetical protein [Archangium sp.]
MNEKTFGVVAGVAFALGMGIAGEAWAGPGTVVIPTPPELGLTVRLGGQVRMIPTLEGNWDLGLSKRTPIRGLGLHVNEAGIVGRDYLRTEDRIYFNVNQGDIWDFYMALEFDSVLAQRRTDRITLTERGIFDDFGMERLQATVKLPWIHSRLHAGWDTGPSADIDAGGIIYVDDDPGIWLTGKAGPLGWKAAYVLKNESHFVYAERTTNVPPPLPIGLFDDSIGERRIGVGRLDLTPVEGLTISGLYVVNHARLRGQPPATGINALSSVTHYPGLLISANVKGFKPLLEVAGSVGSVRYPGTATPTLDYLGNQIDGRTFKVRSLAAFADLAYDASAAVGFKLEPHIGAYYLKGDSNPADDVLGGYTPAVGMPRFAQRFSGENMIVADGNIAYGSPLYSTFPELWGNQGSVMSNGGGLFGNSRSDSPGVTMIGGGVDIEPLKSTLRYRTNAYALIYNERFLVGAIPETEYNNASAVGLLARDTGTKRLVDERLFGVAWDNELIYMITSTFSAKLHVSFVFTGPAAQQVAGALSDQGNGETVEIAGVSFERAQRAQADTMRRIAVELLWNF